MPSYHSKTLWVRRTAMPSPVSKARWAFNY
jgi:hypothetical protein